MLANSPAPNPIPYELWLNNVLSVVKEIADPKKQHEHWRHPNFSWENPNELICCLFDDCMFKEFVEHHEATFSAEQRLASNELVGELQKFLAATPKTLAPDETLKDPGWRLIQRNAARFAETFEDNLPEASSSAAGEGPLCFVRITTAI